MEEIGVPWVSRQRMLSWVDNFLLGVVDYIKSIEFGYSKNP